MSTFRTKLYDWKRAWKLNSKHSDYILKHAKDSDENVELFSQANVAIF